MNNKYKETFDKIPFSADFEQQVIDKLASDAKVPEQRVFMGGKGLFLLPVFGMIIICVAGLFCFGNFYLQGVGNRALNKEDMQKIVGIETVEIVKSEKIDNSFEVRDQSLASGEALILDCGMEVSKGDAAFLQAEVKGADIGYDVGYILDGAFFGLKKGNTSESLVHNVVVEKSGSFYWCINNTSGNAISFSATMQYDSDDLVYRNYGGGVISVDKGCTIRLENIQSLLPLREVKGIYLYHFEQGITEEFPTNAERIEYKVEERGTYSIYALMENGEIVSLNHYVSVDCDSDFNTDENDKKPAFGSTENIRPALKLPSASCTPDLGRYLR